MVSASSLTTAFAIAVPSNVAVPLPVKVKYAYTVGLFYQKV
jgi:hypothetical protein